MTKRKNPRVINTKLNVYRIARDNLVVDELKGGIIKVAGGGNCEKENFDRVGGGGCKMKNFDRVGGGGSNGGISEVVGGGGCCEKENFDRVGGGGSNGGIIEVVGGGRHNNNNNNYTDHLSVKLNSCRNTTIDKVEDNEELSLVHIQDDQDNNFKDEHEYDNDDDINYNDKNDEFDNDTQLVYCNIDPIPSTATKLIESQDTYTNNDIISDLHKHKGNLIKTNNDKEFLPLNNKVLNNNSWKNVSNNNNTLMRNVHVFITPNNNVVKKNCYDNRVTSRGDTRIKAPTTIYINTNNKSSIDNIATTTYMGPNNIPVSLHGSPTTNNNVNENAIRLRPLGFKSDIVDFQDREVKDTSFSVERCPYHKNNILFDSPIRTQQGIALVDEDSVAKQLIKNKTICAIITKQSTLVDKVRNINCRNDIDHDIIMSNKLMETDTINSFVPSVNKDCNINANVISLLGIVIGVVFLEIK